MTVAVTTARRRQDCGERTVLVKTVQERNEDRQSATAEDIRAERAVLRAEHEQRNENPKGGVPR